MTVHLHRRKILFGAVFLMSAVGVLGALVGTWLSTAIDERILRKIFGAMLVASGIVTLQRQK